MTLVAGMTVDRYSSDKKITLTEDTVLRVALLRGLAVGLARSRSVEWYEFAAMMVGVHARGIGPWMDLLDRDCESRGEPDLACFFVNKTTGNCTDYDGSAGRLRASKHWGACW